MKEKLLDVLENIIVEDELSQQLAYKLNEIDYLYTTAIMDRVMLKWLKEVTGLDDVDDILGDIFDWIDIDRGDWDDIEDFVEKLISKYRLKK